MQALPRGSPSQTPPCCTFRWFTQFPSSTLHSGAELQPRKWELQGILHSCKEDILSQELSANSILKQKNSSGQDQVPLWTTESSPEPYSTSTWKPTLGVTGYQHRMMALKSQVFSLDTLKSLCKQTWENHTLHPHSAAQSHWGGCNIRERPIKPDTPPEEFIQRALAEHSSKRLSMQNL